MMRRILTPLGRLATMDVEEVRFRIRAEVRKSVDRIRWRTGRTQWDRASLVKILAPAAASDSAFLTAARNAAQDGDWPGAHCALARHLVHRPAAFPLPPRAVATVAARIRDRFPAAADDALARAERIAGGDYDILGYRGLHVGAFPDWHADPVHDRRAPNGFWADVPYLDPRCGDHKVIWEVNRHQHWLALGRAYALAGDRRSYAIFTAQLRTWLDANPPLTGVNWASMLELAFRTLSWLWAAHVFATTAADESDTSDPWMVDLLIGLERQLNHIVPNLSRYFSPNTHLTGEALALYVAGLSLPFLRGSQRWADTGREVLVAEATRQVLADGGHAELSAHYHRYSTDFYLLALEVARAAGDPAAGVFEDAARRQATYLRAIADDSGQLPLIGDDDGGQLFPICGREPADCRDTLASAACLLNDGALAIGDVPEEVFWRAGGRVPESLWREREATPTSARSQAFPSTGYFVSRTRSGDHLVFDGGAHGYLNGGHAHSDALSVVASVGGRPLLVDPGTATYTMDPVVRDRFRSTAMHNTVVVNGLPQSQPRGPFHWRTRTDAYRGPWRLGEGADYAEGRHAAYAPIVHVRGVLALQDVAWFVIDHFVDTSAPGATAAADPVATDTFWHLHPDWTLVSDAGRMVRLQHRDGQRQHLASSGILGSVHGTRWSDLASYAPCYGRIVPAECLRTTESGLAPRSVLTIVPMGRRAEAELSVQPVPIAAPLADGWYGAAWRVFVDDTEFVLLSSSERSAAAHELGAPPTRWGTTDVQAVARVALLGLAPDGWRAILVNGRHLSSPGVRINHDMARPLIEVDARASSAMSLRVEPSC